MSMFSKYLRRGTALASVFVMAGAGSLRAEEQIDLNQLKLQVDELQQKLAGLETSKSATGKLRLIDSSVDILLAAGGSSVGNDELGELQGGGHDPNKRGFTLQQAELSFAGTVDQLFSGEMHVVLLEDEIELEEAFLTSSSLPAGLQLKGGYYLTEFGRINPTHPHSWAWIDQPIIAGRLLGGDGIRGAGVRLGWLAPTPWYSQFLIGVQNADNASMSSFLGEGHSHGEEEHPEEELAAEEADHEETHVHDLGVEETVAGLPAVGRDINGLDDYLYSLRWENSGDVSDETTALFGLSTLYGPNATGENGETLIYGADLTLKWRPARNDRGYPFVSWQTEVMTRDFESDEAFIPHDDHEHVFPAETVEDWGFYSQLVWGFRPGWETGLRFEYATGSDDGLEERASDPARCDRIRISPMIAYRPSEFSRIRLQYNYDDADFLDDGEAHTVWAGLEVLYGSHPAHKY